MGHVTIDRQGFRANVAMVLCNSYRRVLWARRIDRHGWQFPQGGIEVQETPEQAMYRELREEVGLLPEHVEVLGTTNGWLRYRLPKDVPRRDTRADYVGQKQCWYLLRLLADDERVALHHAPEPEFDQWRWVDYWHPMSEVAPFKRAVYQAALTQLSGFLP